MNAVAREKAALRKTLLNRRTEVAAEGTGARLAEHFRDGIPIPDMAAISVFVPINGEIDVAPLTCYLRAAGHLILLPVTPAAPCALGFRVWHKGDALIDGPFGTREPPLEAAAGTPDILIVPLLGFDRAGRRLGYGAGYYDRTLAALRKSGPVTAVGVAFAAQEVPEVPHQRWDEILDWIVTEDEVISVEGKSERT
jgi:5-formyltetrahydrofolate cyclo-ligase